MATTPRIDAEPGKDATADTMKTLEAKYIELLERQVRLLEARISNESLESSGPARPRTLSLTAQAGKDTDTSDEKDNDDATTTDGGSIQYRMKRYNDEGFLVEEPYDPKKLEAAKLPESMSIATIMLYFDSGRTHTETEIKIESTAVRPILQEKLRHYPGYHWESPHLSLFAPFQPLIHNWDVLRHVANSKPADEGCRDLADILDAVQSSKEVKEYFEMRGSMEGSVVFDFLWTIFPPGEFIMLPNSFMKQEQVFIVRSAAERRVVDHFNQRGDRKYMAIYCWAYDWDGSRRMFNRVGVELKIDFYKGHRLITSLPCYPLRYYPGNMEELRERLIARGKRFEDYCTHPRGQQMFEYDGLAYYRGTGVRHIHRNSRSGSIPDDASFIHIARLGRLSHSMSSELSAKSGRPLNMKGKVMVDFESYHRHGPNEPIPMGQLTLSNDDADEECRCPKCNADGGPKDNQKYDWDLVNNIEHNDQYLICAPRLLGYHLMEKKWLELLVDKVYRIEKPEAHQAFGKLDFVGNTAPEEMTQAEQRLEQLSEETIRAAESFWDWSRGD